LIVALCAMLAITGSVLTLMLPSRDIFSSQSEAADMQQRLRVATDTLYNRLLVAGVGASTGASSGPLNNDFAPLLPYRSGGVVTDPPGSFKSDTITIFSVARDAVQATSRTYWLKSDEAAGTYQLMLNESANNADVPVVDHLVGLIFEYLGDPQHPMIREPADAVGPWRTTYGPRPTSAVVSPFTAGANCLFANDGASVPQPRLAFLGAPGTSLVKLTAAQLVDGPWCPNDMSAARWDADLLRIRAVAVTVRVQAALSALRGPASVLFAHGGTARGAQWVPDQQIRFQVTPRNLNLGR